MIHRPAAELAHDLPEGLFTASLLRVQRGEVLSEALAQPLLVIILPTNGLAPPLMREFVGDKELREVVERRRVVPERKRCNRQRVVEHGKIARTVAAGAVVLDHRNRHRVIRHIIEK